MKTKSLIFILCFAASGCTNSRYPNWEYVRVESAVPDKSCVYKMQESCSQRANACFNWHKQRATTFGANTVVIVQNVNQNQLATGMFGIKGGDNASTLADYYQCNTAKNIIPKVKD